MNKRAFTLIELLVVIAIIGILASLIVPVMGRAREGARRAMCANNLRQHGVAWYLYLDDHNECFPRWGNPPSDFQCDSYTFGGKAGSEYAYPPDIRPLNRYLDVNDTSSAEIFHCPDDTKTGIFLIDKTVFDFYGTSYFLNAAILKCGSAGSYEQRPFSTIIFPHSKVFLEMCNTSTEPGHGSKGPVSWLIDIHVPVMVLFVDGHAKGPYIYPDEFNWSKTDDHFEKPVYTYPDATPDG